MNELIGESKAGNFKNLFVVIIDKFFRSADLTGVEIRRNPSQRPAHGYMKFISFPACQALALNSSTPHLQMLEMPLC